MQGEPDAERALATIELLAPDEMDPVIDYGEAKSSVTYPSEVRRDDQIEQWCEYNVGKFIFNNPDLLLKAAQYKIPQSMKDDDPCLMYLILLSSPDRAPFKQTMFDIYEDYPLNHKYDMYRQLWDPDNPEGSILFK